ncbi:MAG: hypothetical protein AB9869_38315 [Verrucomicrobiia bacterium]
MKTSALLVGILCWRFGSALSLHSDPASTPPPPQLQVQASGPAEVLLRWPAAARDYGVEEAFALAPGFVWQRADHAAQLSGDWQVLRMFPSGASRYFRLRYRSSDLLSTNAVIHFALTNPAGGSVVAGRPFPVEVRASLNAVLVGAAFRVVTTGGARATLTSRSPSPAQDTGLIFVSTTSQQPFEPGLPMEIGETGALEVLLGTGAWPHDGIVPGENILLERLEITPSSSGELTLSLADLQAVTSRWAKDGKWFESVSLHPWQPSVTVQVEPGPAAPPQSAPGGQAPVMGAPAPGKAGVPSSINANADGQGAVDVADLVFVRARLGLDAALAGNARADVNQDQKIDLLDLVAVRNRLTPLDDLGSAPQVRLNEVAPNPSPGEAPWVELLFTRPGEEFSLAPELRNGAQEVLLALWTVRVPTWLPFVVIVFDGEKPTEYLGNPEAPSGARVHVPWPAVGSVFNPTNDQCLFYLGGELVDSVAWGPRGERSAAVNTQLLPIPTGGSIGRDGYEQERWVRFAPSTPGADNGLSAPVALCPLNGGGVRQGDSTRFLWMDPRYAPVLYDLEVDDAADFQTPLLKVQCSEAAYAHSPGLGAGKYFWRVRAKAGDLASPWSGPAEFEVLDLPELSAPRPVAAQSLSSPLSGLPPPSHVIRWFDNNAIPLPHKDTTMVCLECDQASGPHAWDRPHGTKEGATGPCPHELGHSATAMAATLNHYYGGNLTQDEINEMNSGASGPEKGLQHGVVTDILETMQIALESPPQADSWSSDIFDSTRFALDLLSAAWTISGGIPLVANVYRSGKAISFGPVVLYGYLHPRDSREYTFLAKGPFLPQPALIKIRDDDPGWQINAYRPPSPPKPGKPAPQTDSDVQRDSDDDGLCDFDELSRFETSLDERDTDGDGLDDKTEIWSYKFGRGWATRTPDLDGDGARAETDPDTDGDGCLDGAEDRNHNGTLYYASTIYTSYASPIPFTSKDSDETDPFWVDEFKLTLTAARTTIRFGECTRLEVKVTDKDGAPVKDAEVRFKMDPQIATYGASGGTPITFVALLTDKDGKGSTDFCAQETEGTVTVEGRYKPCPQGKENKAELKIQILPYDWIFAVQEKAVLTGPTLTNQYTITVDHASSGARAYADADTRKDWGFQKISGRFQHPKTDRPGLCIERVWIDSAASSCVLSVDGQRVGTSWFRTNALQNPSSWEVAVAEFGLKEETLARALFVQAIGGRARSTPLLWWYGCGVGNRRKRTIYSATAWSRDFLLAFDYYYHSYGFFFGDGDRYGNDPAWTWPNEAHTRVSFIPVSGLPGREIGTYGGTSEPPEDWYNPVRSGVCDWYRNFMEKDTVAWMPPAPWISKEITGENYLVQEDLTSAGALTPGAFIKEFRFKRDYIGDELKELQQRKLEAPEYEIRMLTGE